MKNGWIVFAILVSQVVLNRPTCADETALRWQTYDQPGFAASRRRQYEAAELALTNHLQKLIADPKPSDQLILAYLQRLVNVCICQAKYDQGAKYAELSIRYGEKVGLDNIHLAMLHCTLGKLWCKQSKLSQAQMEYSKATGLLNGFPAAQTAATVTQINIGMADVLTKQQHFADAEPLYSKALVEKATTPGPLKFTRSAGSPPDLLALAECLVGLGKLDEAASRIQQALSQDTEDLGAGQPALAAEFNDLACVLVKQHKLAEAETNMTAAVKICRAYKYADLPDWLENLARVLSSEGKTAEAGAINREIAALRSAARPMETSSR
jgi:tetratricopeptide (TPR) repeat protein